MRKPNLTLAILLYIIIVMTMVIGFPLWILQGIPGETQEMGELIRQGSSRIDYGAVCRGDAGEELVKLAAQYGNCKK